MKLFDAIMNEKTSPPLSAVSSPSASSRRSRSPLALDLSDVPALIHPSPPSNTLLITNLQDLTIFKHEYLNQVKALINQIALIYSWSPLKSFRRIVVSFYDVESALRIKQALDGEAIMGDRVRIYFGEPTRTEPVDQHLKAPASDKLFFISPPPSPPHGWQMKNEDPPNRDVHADDLALALSRLDARSRDSPSVSPVDTATDEKTYLGKRQRAGSATMIYHPDEHGDSPNLPAIAVEDFTGTAEDVTLLEAPPTQKMVHTTRPPVELMQDS